MLRGHLAAGLYEPDDAPLATRVGGGRSHSARIRAVDGPLTNGSRAAITRGRLLDVLPGSPSRLLVYVDELRVFRAMLVGVESVLGPLMWSTTLRPQRFPGLRVRLVVGVALGGARVAIVSPIEGSR
jgi:hypothetical protein